MDFSELIRYYQPTVISALRKWTNFASEEPEIFSNAIIESVNKKSEEEEIFLPYKVPTTDYEVEIRDEEYLKPSPYCEVDAKEILGMAVKLGAFDKEPKEYAEAVFNFVKGRIDLKFSVQSMGALNCLKTGIGGPADKTSLFIALCRVGRLKSRYNLTAEIQFKDNLHNFLVNETGSFGKFYSVLDFFPIHINAEVMIDDKWIPADTTFTPEFELPLRYAPTQLGHDPSGYWERGHQGYGMSTESLPLEFWNLYKEILVTFPGAIKNINDAVNKLTKKGKEILNNIEEKEKYERMMKGIKSYDELAEELTNKLKNKID